VVRYSSFSLFLNLKSLGIPRLFKLRKREKDE